MNLSISDNAGNQTLYRLKDKGKVKWRGKRTFNLCKNIEEQLPGYFKVDRDHKLINCNDEQYQEVRLKFLIDDTEETGNNEEIYKEEGTQQLSKVDVQELIASKNNASDIINTITSGNKNFEKRHKISKQKYIDRKQQKCTIQNINQYFIKKLNSYIFLKEDQLGFFLNQIQIQDKDQIFLDDGACGIVAAHCLKRCKEGNKILLFEPKNYTLENFNLKKFEAIRLLNLQPKSQQFIEVVNCENLLEKVQNINSVLLCSEHNPLSIIQKIQDRMSSNCYVVIFTRFYEIAKECFLYFTKNGYVNNRIKTHVQRDYQIYPQRTHPEMKMNGLTGFIVSSIKIYSPKKIDQINIQKLKLIINNFFKFFYFMFF